MGYKVFQLARNFTSDMLDLVLEKQIGYSLIESRMNLDLFCDLHI